MVNENEVPSDTSKVEGIGGGRTCAKCGQSKQWRQGKWVCLEHESAMPQDWRHPQSGGLTVKGGLGEHDKVEIVRQSQEDSKRFVEVKAKIQVPDLVTVPAQAREIFQKIVWTNLDVRLNKVQAENFLHELEDMPTPAKMSDAKAIIALVNQLEDFLKETE